MPRNVNEIVRGIGEGLRLLALGKVFSREDVWKVVIKVANVRSDATIRKYIKALNEEGFIREHKTGWKVI